MNIDITITEVLSRTITINANSEEKALLITNEMYRNEEIVLDYNDFNQDVIIEKQVENSNLYKPYNYGVGSDNSTGMYISKEDMIAYHIYKSQVKSNEGKEWHLKRAEVIKKKV